MQAGERLASATVTKFEKKCLHPFTHFKMRSRGSVPLEIWWIMILPRLSTWEGAATSMRRQI